MAEKNLIDEIKAAEDQAAASVREAKAAAAVRPATQLRAWALEHVSARRLGQVAAAIINEIVAEGRSRRR